MRLGHGVLPFFGNGGELLSGWIGFPARRCSAGRRSGDGWCFVVHGGGAFGAVDVWVWVDGGESVSFGQAGGITLWQAGFFESGFGSGNVVGHAAVDEALLLEVVEHVTGTGVFIARLTHAADIHGVALRGVELGGRFRGVVATAGEGLGVFLPE